MGHRNRPGLDWWCNVPFYRMFTLCVTVIGLKLTLARAKCIVEIHRAEIEDRNENFGSFVDQQVSGCPFEYSVPGLKMLMVWEDNEGRNHVSICPCISELVRHCSGATSPAPRTAAPSNPSEPLLREQ